MEGYKLSWLTPQPNNQGLGKIILKFTPPEESINSLAAEVVLGVVRLNLGLGGVLPHGEG